MYIGFFDSGIGGITVLYDSIRLLKNIDYLYYADTDNVPYGIKDKEIVKGYIFKAVDFMVNEGVDGLVIACNTATSIAIRELRSRYQLPIIGMEPAVKPAVEHYGDKRVLVLATPLTLKEDKYEDLVSKVDEANIVDSLPLPELVKYAEGFKFDGEEIKRYLLDKLSRYELSDYGTIVLGCTHFLYFRKLLQEILPVHINLIDGNIGTIRHLGNILSLEYNSDRLDALSFEDYNINLLLSGKKGDISELYRYLDVLQQLK